MSKLTYASMALVMALVAVPALAGTPAEEAREANQEQRIQQGEASGALTDQEAAHLEKGQAHIDKAEAKAASDGVVTKREKRHIAHMQNRQSRRIHHKKHNAKTEPTT